MANAPPLGHLRGMYYDAERRRYFPLTAAMTAPPVCKPAPRKRKAWDVNESSAVQRRVQRALGPRRDDNTRLRTQTLLANTNLAGIAGLCECHGEKITSVKSFETGGLCVTTDNGQVIISCPDGNAYSFTACSQQLLGVHCNVARGTWLVVANGNEPHVHSWRRDPLNSPTVPNIEQQTIDIPQRDIFAMSSFDTVTTLALPRSINTVTVADDRLSLSPRRLQSDPMRLHHTTMDLVYVALRSSSILLEDLREAPGAKNIVATMPRGRAVTGVQRLKDSAVPFGLVASGMDHQLMLFDVRYSKGPLRELHGHNNPYHPQLALATSPDDTVVFAGGFDYRLRAWSTVTGEPILPANNERRNALKFDFKHPVQHVDVSNDYAVRAASAGDILRFETFNPDSKKRDRGQWRS